MVFTLKIYQADGTTAKRTFKSKKELINELISGFDGQAFWLNSERLGEVPDEIQYNWKKLTPKYLEKMIKGVYIPYLFDTRLVKRRSSKQLGRVI